MNAIEMVDQLNAFADAESVKEFLKLMGVKGYRQDETSCPISTWIHNGTGHPTITENTIKVFHGDARFLVDYYEFDISEAVKDFITAFDLGRWPELDADWVEGEDGMYEDHGNPWI